MNDGYAFHQLENDVLTPGARASLNEAAAKLSACQGNALEALEIFKAGAKGLAGFVQCRLVERADAIDELLYTAQNYGLVDDLGERVIGAAIVAALDEPVDVPSPQAAEVPVLDALPYDDGAPPVGEVAQAVESKPLVPFTAAELAQDDPQAVRWLVKNRVPMAAHTLLSGDGAAGKTTILLQLCHAVATGRQDWLGGLVEERGPVIFLTGEEDRPELHRRLGAVCSATNTRLSDLSDLHLLSMPGESIVMASTLKTGSVVPTPFLQSFEAAADRIKPRLIAIEAAADVFAGNENSRPEVRQFGQIMRRLAIKADAALVLVQHPSVAGLAEGSGRSGSTHWRNSFRAQMVFSAAGKPKDDDDGADSGLRTLAVTKSNYGPAGEQITVRWDRGIFAPEGSLPSLDRIAAEAEVDATFLRLLEQATAQGRTLSPVAGRNSAGATMQGMPDARGIKARAFDRAMERLLAADRIVVEEFGPPSKRRQRLAKKAG